MAKTIPSRKSSETTTQQANRQLRAASKRTSAPAAARQATASRRRSVAQEPKSKIAVIVALLRRSNGASIEDLIKATGWQAHSIRGAISAGIKKKLGLNVTCEKTETGRFYRVTDTRAS